MDIFSLVLLVSVILCCLHYYFKQNLAYFEKLGIPHRPGWPIIGNMWPLIRDSILGRKNFLETMHEEMSTIEPLEAKYVGTFMFSRPVVILRDLELIKTVGVKNFDSFPDRTYSADVPNADPFFSGSLFNMQGKKWREARNVLSPAFTSSKLKGMFQLMRSCGQTLLEHLESKNADRWLMTNTKDLFTRFTNDAIATCAFAINVDSLNDPDNEFYALGYRATNLGAWRTFKFHLQRVYPRLANFLNVRFLEDHVIDFFMNLVRSTTETREQQGIQRPDMLQLMIDAQRRDHEHLKLDIVQMTAQAFVFFFGGFESTSTQMCFIAHELATHPDVQEKLQAEIDDVLKKTGGELTYEALNEMVYLDAVWNEALRMHAHIPIERYCVKALELPPPVPGGKPVIIQPGTHLVILAQSIHWDSKYYENPRSFDPDRYLNKKVTINDPTNLGFGIGPRACIGNRFAIVETKVLFFYLLSKFNLRPNAKTCIPLEYEPKASLLKAKGGFWLTLEPRKLF